MGDAPPGPHAGRCCFVAMQPRGALPLHGHAPATTVPRVPDHADITPVPLPMSGDRIDQSVKTLLVFGGSFDPPHKGHVQLPLLAARHLERVRDEARGVYVLFVPAARSPHKQGGPRASNAQRAEMLRLAVGHLPRCGVWTDELDRTDGSPSFTVDTLRRLRAWLDAHGGEDIALRLLIGQDQAQAFSRWREPEAIETLAPPLVMARPDASANAGAALSAHFAFVPIGTLEASSTQVRAALASEDAAALKRLLDPTVAAYITEQNLYPRTD